MVPHGPGKDCRDPGTNQQRLRKIDDQETVSFGQKGA
jgi:hypothetical protein